MKYDDTDMWIALILGMVIGAVAVVVFLFVLQ